MLWRILFSLGPPYQMGRVSSAVINCFNLIFLWIKSFDGPPVPLLICLQNHCNPRSSHYHRHHHVGCRQSSCEATAEKCIWMFKGWNSPASVQVFKFDRKFSSCPRQVLHHSSLHSQHHHSTIIPPSLHYHSTSPTSSEPPTIYQ